MNKIIVVFFSMIALISCAETWQGVKKDSKEIGHSIGEAGTELGEAISDVFNGDKEAEE